MVIITDTLNRESIKHYVPPDGSTHHLSISFKQTNKHLIKPSGSNDQFPGNTKRKGTY